LPAQLTLSDVYRRNTFLAAQPLLKGKNRAAPVRIV